jgi:hypothetical protein
MTISADFAREPNAHADFPNQARDPQKRGSQNSLVTNTRNDKVTIIETDANAVLREPRSVNESIFIIFEIVVS